MSRKNNKHTPGPWTLSGNYVVRGPRDEGVNYGNENPIVVTIRANQQYRPGSVDERNAMLISAAPDLLEALKGLLPHTFTGNPTRQKEREFWESEKEEGNGKADSVLAAYDAIEKAIGLEESEAGS